MPVIKNMTPGPLSIELNSGEFIRLSPGASSENIPGVELQDNPKIAKLSGRRAIAVTSDDDEAQLTAASSEESGAAAPGEPAPRARRK